MDETKGERLSDSERLTGQQSQMRNHNKGNGNRGSCNYQYSGSKTKGDTYGVSLWQGGATGQKSAWTAFSSDHTKNHEEVRNQAFRETQGDSSTQTTSKTEKQSASYFNSHIDDGSSSSTGAHSEDHASGNRDSTSHAEGLGQSSNESKAQSENSMQGTSQSHADGEEHRERNTSGFSVMDGAKLHQRFEHLKMLYDQYSEHIEHHRRQLMAGMGPKFGQFVYKGCLPGLPEACYVGSSC